MAEKGQTSSMTSVTEEDSSPDSESDTTETFSNHTSSVMSSTDTDDKLTPGLINITISTSPTKKKKQQNLIDIQQTKECEAPSPVETQKTAESNTNSKCPSPGPIYTSYVFPYGSNPLPLKSADFTSTCMNKRRGIPLPHNYQDHSGKTVEDYGCKENLGLDDTDNRLSTDFSDTSSIQFQKTSSTGAGEVVDEVCTVKRYKTNDQRPLYPDLSSSNWYQASCFDHYWKHYNFVMDWYQKHIQAVETLQSQMGAPLFFPPHFNSVSPQRAHRQSPRSRRNKSLKRSRRRSNARKRQEQSGTRSLPVSDEVIRPARSSEHSYEDRSTEDDVEDIEMEITEDMVEFFATSLKHKLERDTAKQESDMENSKERLNIEETKKGQQSASILAPQEQPGLRRATELRELYGPGAPMIHGMETALQMTYDRFSDKFQPKMWPNMPLKIIFT